MCSNNKQQKLVIMSTVIKVAVAALKLVSAYLIAKKVVEAGDERWGKNPQQ